MSEYFDIVQFKKGKGDKTFAVRLGRASKRDDGGFWLNLDALPFGEGSCAIVPQRDRAQSGAPTKSPGRSSDDLDSDTIPF